MVKTASLGLDEMANSKEKGFIENLIYENSIEEEIMVDYILTHKPSDLEKAISYLRERD